MKVVRYLLFHNKKAIGYFSNRDSAVDMWNRIVCKDLSRIDEYKVVERIFDDNVINDINSLFHLLETE